MRPTGMRRAAFPFLAIAGVVALSGCGSTGPLTPDATPGSPASTSTTSTSAPPTGATPVAPSPTKATTASLTGTVSRAAVEGGCLVLTASGRDYFLVGAVSGITAGQRVSVTGHVDESLATTCQTGIPFVVESVESASPSAG